MVKKVIFVLLYVLLTLPFSIAGFVGHFIWDATKAGIVWADDLVDWVGN